MALVFQAEMFIGLLLRAMKNDVNLKRVSAFSKRVLQVSYALYSYYWSSSLSLLSFFVDASEGSIQGQLYYYSPFHCKFQFIVHEYHTVAITASIIIILFCLFDYCWHNIACAFSVC